MSERVIISKIHEFFEGRPSAMKQAGYVQVYYMDRRGECSRQFQAVLADWYFAELYPDCNHVPRYRLLIWTRDNTRYECLLCNNVAIAMHTDPDEHNFFRDTIGDVALAITVSQLFAPHLYHELQGGVVYNSDTHEYAAASGMPRYDRGFTTQVWQHVKNKGIVPDRYVVESIAARVGPDGVSRLMTYLQYMKAETNTPIMKKIFENHIEAHLKDACTQDRRIERYPKNIRISTNLTFEETPELATLARATPVGQA